MKEFRYERERNENEMRVRLSWGRSWYDFLKESDYILKAVERVQRF